SAVHHRDLRSFPTRRSSDLRQQLVDGDPLTREGDLDAANAQRIRRRILAEARTQPVRVSSWWPRPLVVAGALAACLLLAIAIGRSEEHTSELQSLRHLVCRL